MLLLLCGGVLLLMAAVTNGAGFSLDGIKGRTVGDGQHGTARFAGRGEIRRTFHRVQFRPRAWRRGKHLPKVQGLVVGCEIRGKRVTALVDLSLIHILNALAVYERKSLGTPILTYIPYSRNFMQTIRTIQPSL